MRLIDADQLKMQIAAAVADKGAESAHKAVMLACVIDNQPTIEAAPVVHGEWKITDITTEDGWAMYCCPKCNWHTEFYYSFSAKPEYNFCPNCGADMRKGGVE